MISLTRQHSADLKQILDEISHAQDEDALRRQMVERIHTAFCSSSTIFWRIDADNRLVAPVFKGIQDHYLMPYKQYFYRQNPFDPGNIPHLSRPSLLMEQLVPHPAFHRTEYYNDFIRPQQIRRQMAVYIPYGGRLHAVIGMHRAATRGFGENCLFMGDLISQWTTAAFERLELKKQLSTEQSIRRIFEDRTDTGVLLFDTKGRCVYANAAGQKKCALLKPAPPASDRSGHVLRVPEIIRKGVDRILAGQLITGRQMVRCSGSPQLEIRWQPLDTILPDFAVMVSLSDIGDLNQWQQSRLKQVYPLTPREIEIITHVCKGRSNADIADTLFISEGTVKNHLKHIFVKMKVSNRTQVVHKALFAANFRPE